jgi:hypothetical protein
MPPPGSFPAPHRIEIKGRVWSRLPGVNVSGIAVRVKPDPDLHPVPAPHWFADAQTDRSGRFEAVGTGYYDGKAWVYLNSPEADSRWTYRPAEVSLRPTTTTEVVDLELIEGVDLRLTFLDADDGGPVEGLAVVVIPEARVQFLGLFSPRRSTDNQGEIRVRIPPGEIRLEVVRSADHRIWERYGVGQIPAVTIPDVRTLTLPVVLRPVKTRGVGLGTERTEEGCPRSDTP